MNEENTDLEKELEDVISRSKAQKAKETEDLIKKNYEQTGYYETDTERRKREK